MAFSLRPSIPPLMLQNSLIDPLSADGTDKRRKNADAQAAFRARRAKYITTLEETGAAEVYSLNQALIANHSVAVTLLEATLVELQESCRANKADAKKLQADATGLRNEARDREKFWRAVWQTKKTGMPPDSTDDVSLPSYARTHSSPPSVPGGMISESSTHYDPALRFPHDPFSLLSGYDDGPPPRYPQRSPALDYPNVDGNGSIITRPPYVTGYAPQPPYTQEGSSPADKSWQQLGLQGHSGYPTIDDSQPPTTYAASPTVTSSDASCPNQYGGVVNDAKMADGTPKMHPESSSILPASTPMSTSSTSLAYRYNFPENSVIPDFRYSIGTRELTLPGGTANIPVAGMVGDGLQYRSAAATHASTMPNTSLVSAPYSRSDNTLDGRGSDRSNSVSTVATASSSHISCSPSPDSPCNTLSIIKAQCFRGNFRRDRKQAPRPGAAKAAVDAFGTVPGTNANTKKRPRRDDNEDTHP